MNTTELIATIKPDLVMLCDSEEMTAERHAALSRIVEQLTPPNLLALVEALESAQRKIVELEARAVSVNIPRYDLDMSGCDSCGQDCGADMSEEPDGDYVLLTDVVEKLVAAGIKCEVKGE